ncbi:Probable E3 ubiquitin-protein ligase [Seminavis robusta]|uniref:Probable E3 ubiquitin-protein ligase n=1 Tax=Seminavis robusta TaxID=568900 RepID=A0A9N8DUV4_9STRA|nr:Probable E3 ubiquitin-protein ligase [Seminavis robusta]|eukprot:Sro368_g128040.1 Probable E3 ubiquitin-protein ligase (1343) ;mRNA; r:52538-56655
MSLTNVLLIHVSTLFLPQTKKQEEKEQENEYYTCLDLPRYAPICDIRKSYRRISLRLQCDRMMLEWNGSEDIARAAAALDAKEKSIKDAFQILGDKHLRQQYHLLQCRPSRYRVIRGPLSWILNLTHSRRWFPFLVLQSVILAAMVDATLKGLVTQDWVMVLIPSWGYYGVVCLFWLAMLEHPWRKQCTLRSFGAMFSAFGQHAALWLGCFWMARYWDRDVPESINWYILSTPFYAAIFFRCHCTTAAIACLRDLQSKMVSRELMESVTTANTIDTASHADDDNNDDDDHAENNDNHNQQTQQQQQQQLPEGYIVITGDANKVAAHLIALPDEEMQAHSSDPNKMEQIRVESSPEYVQVDRAAVSLYRSMVKLAVYGTIFVTLMALKLERHFNVSFWIVFSPIWIHLGIRLYTSSRAVRRATATAFTSTTTTNNSTTTNTPATPATGNSLNGASNNNSVPINVNDNTNMNNSQSLLTNQSTEMPASDISSIHPDNAAAAKVETYPTDSTNDDDNNNNNVDEGSRSVPAAPDSPFKEQVVVDIVMQAVTQSLSQDEGSTTGVEIPRVETIFRGDSVGADQVITEPAIANNNNTVDDGKAQDSLVPDSNPTPDLPVEPDAPSDHFDMETGLVERVPLQTDDQVDALNPLDSSGEPQEHKVNELDLDPAPQNGQESGIEHMDLEAGMVVDGMISIKTIFSPEINTTQPELVQTESTASIHFLPSLARGSFSAPGDKPLLDLLADGDNQQQATTNEIVPENPTIPENDINNTSTTNVALAAVDEGNTIIVTTNGAISTLEATQNTPNTAAPPVQDSSHASQAEAPAVREEFERWQSVYENQDIRTAQFHLVPCEVFFQLLVLCLIVAKLDSDYDTDDPSGFNAFLVILIPFSIGLVVCCCAIIAGCIELAHQELNRADPTAAVIDPAANDAQASGGEAEADSLQTAPMQAGENKNVEPTYATHLDVYTPQLTFTQRTLVLIAALQISKIDAETWLLEKDNAAVRNTRTLWGMVTQCASDLGCHEVNLDVDTNYGFDEFNMVCLAILRKNLAAHFQKAEFQRVLDAIKPLDEQDEDADPPLQHNEPPALHEAQEAVDGIEIPHQFLQEESYIDGGDVDEEKKSAQEPSGENPEQATPEESVVGMECLVCCEEYRITDTVHCEGDEIHFFCRGCFHRYATETVQAGDIAGMPCANANCSATFATPTVRANLSQWDILRMEDRENERNKRVALAAKAVLRCPCGGVGIVTEEDVGDGCITCPGSECGLQYCALCGNHWHPDTTCPPTKKMLQWVIQNTMPCPNCHTPIEKNSGCDHMHCAPPGGCGHHFSYRTGKPMSKHGRNLRGLYH